jgi:TonB family protein
VILAWMLSAMLFSLFVAVAAFWAERLLRAASRPGRGAWLLALAAGTIWPVLVPLLRRVWPTLAPVASARDRAMVLGAIRIAPDPLSGSGSWAPVVDRILLIAWLALSMLLVLRYALLWLAVRRLRQRADRATIDGVDVLVSAELGPAVIGLRDTAVILPRAMLDLDAPLRRLVLRHEEEHRLAGDSWVLLGLTVAVAAMPWNFPLWWIARRARLALEVDCDARVIAAGESVTRYVQVLLLATQRVSAAPLTPMLVASRTHLERRIVAMHQSSDSRRALHTVGAAAACLVALIAACSSPISDEPAGVGAGTKQEAASKRPINVGQPYFEFQVEKQVQTAPGSPQPQYPAALKSAKVEGDVLVQFVVDTTGRAEISTFKVLKADNQQFTDAVKTALPRMRFTPAEVGGRKVKQLVQQPFTFASSSSVIAQPVQIPNPKPNGR